MHLVLYFMINNKIKTFVVKCSPNDESIYKSTISKLYKIADYRFYVKDGETHDITIQGFWTNKKPENQLCLLQIWLKYAKLLFKHWNYSYFC